MTDNFEKLKAEILEKQKMLEDLTAEKAKMSDAKRQIEIILDKSGYSIQTLFPDITRPAPARRYQGIPKFKIGDQTFDGRTARREEAFQKYIVEQSLDLVALARDGIINPEWVEAASPRQLNDMGILDVKEYKKKHGI